MAVVTISRSVGSLGDEVAQAVAERLHYRLVGRTELLALASGFGSPAELARAPELRERSPSFWERLNEERHRYASVLRNVTLKLAEEDDAVIVGLGAGQVLRDLRHVLRVQVVAPTGLRLERLMRDGGEDRPGPLTRDQARDHIRHRDREASGYIRYLFNIDWLDPINWDLVLNTGRFSPAEGGELIAAVVGTSAVQMREEDRRRLGDLALAGQVESTLLNHPSVWVNGLRVRCQNGNVAIEGEVIADDDRDLVEEVVLALPGVHSVENDVRIQPPPLTGM